jgi:hypothetical protein
MSLANRGHRNVRMYQLMQAEISAAQPRSKTEYRVLQRCTPGPRMPAAVAAAELEPCA